MGMAKRAGFCENKETNYVFRTSCSHISAIHEEVSPALARHCRVIRARR